jgi:penicillin amidase
MKKFKVLKYIFFILFFIGAGVVLGFYFLFRLSLPSEDGVTKLNGLKNEVVVTWDSWGIPHIRAENEQDLFLAAGYIQAQQRMWQMDILRRVAQGRLSEILGEIALTQDIKSRVLGLPLAIENDYRKMSPEMKERLEAYARGVNSWIASRKWNWPPEFVLLRIRPEPWRVEDSLAIKQVLALGLAADLNSEIIRYKLVKRFGARALEIMEEGIDFLPETSVKIDFLKLSQIHSGVLEGSNNWVVSGKMSDSGKPLLANDPHLMISVPPIWMEIGLDCPEFKAIGVTIPGVPLVIIGHNEKIAWGVTNSYVDVEDLYFEKIDSSNNTYLRGKEWKPLVVNSEVIKIRGKKEPKTLNIPWTERGPILTPFLIASEMPVSLCWTIYEGDQTMEGLYRINKARNWPEFCQGVSLLENPSQNFVYADVDGNIGYYLSGKIPIRKKEAAVYPYPGWKVDGQWTGYIKEEEKPNIFNPENGYIITANSSIVPDGYKYYLGFDWLAPYRKARIEELIKDKNNLNLNYFLRIQNDIFSKRAERVQKILRQLKFSNPEAEEVRKMLTQWSGEIDAGLAPALFEVFWKKLEELTFKDELQNDFEEASVYFRVKEAGLERILDQPDSPWFDNQKTAEREDRNEIIEQSLLASIKYLNKEVSKNKEKWNWASLHSLKYQHLLGSKWYFGFFNCGEYPMTGDETTVRASFNPYGWKTTGGASCRLLFDLADLENSLGVITSGESGHYLSPHYQDQIPLYLNSLYHPLAFSAESLKRVKSKSLKLVPLN